MGKYSIINSTTNKVVDIVMWSGDTNEWQPPDGHYCVEHYGDGGIGWIYNSGGVGVGTTVGDTTHKWRPPCETSPDRVREALNLADLKVINIET